jgi:hypothetical protein
LKKQGFPVYILIEKAACMGSFFYFGGAVIPPSTD